MWEALQMKTCKGYPLLRWAWRAGPWRCFSEYFGVTVLILEEWMACLGLRQIKQSEARRICMALLSMASSEINRGLFFING